MTMRHLLQTILLALVIFSPMTGAAQSSMIPHRPGANPKRASSLETGLLARYCLDGNAVDSSGNGRDGTIFGATATFDRFNAAAAALSFNGITGNYVAIPPSVETDSFSVSVWAKGTPSTQTSFVYQGTKEWNVGTDELGQIYFEVDLSDHYWYLVRGEPLTTNWTHVVAVYRKGLYMKLYVNNTLQDSVGIPSLDFFSPGFLSCIGAAWGGTVNNFPGSLDEVRIYSRELSRVEVAELYHSGVQPTKQIIASAGSGGTIDPSGTVLIDSTLTIRFQIHPNDGYYLDSLIVDDIPVDSVASFTFHSVVADHTIRTTFRLATLADGLAAYYPFNGGASDESGNHRDGTVLGPAITPNRQGNPSAAFTFDGVDDLIQLPPATTPSAFTLSLWMKGSAKPNAAYLTHGSSAWIAGNDAGGRVSFGVELTDNLWRTVHGKVNNNVWTHVVGRYRQGERLDLFVDDVHVDSLIHPTGYLLASNPFGASIGSGGGANYFPGSIDDIRIYHRFLAKWEIDSLFRESGWLPPPTAAVLRDTTIIGIGRTASVPLSFSAAGSDPGGGTIMQTRWYIDGEFAGSQEVLTHDFGQGTSQVKLVIITALGQRDSSTANVTILGLANRLGGPVTAGLSLAADSAIFAVARGYAVYRLDANLDEVFDLQVNGDIFSSASIGADTAVYFGSTDKSLYGFTHFGAPLWPSLPLGGILSSTPTIDSVGDRIFVGVQNRNLFCIDRATGHVVWNYFTDAPIDQSAVITVDRKLVFTTKKGTIYGFDLNALPVPPAPSWSFALGDTVTSSPAVDAGANIYVGTSSGKVMKVILQRDIPVSVAWQCVLGGSVIASPVIDAAGTLYAGSLDSALYAIDVVSGVVKWSRKTAGPIRSTPAISNEGTIFVGNDAGEFRAYDGTGDLKWRYLHTAPIRSPILWNDGMVYFGTEDSLVIALRERPSLISTRAILAGMTPVWGTFQGNNSRTGMQSPNNLSSVVTATGWNIVSVHLMTPDQRPSALFPAATTPAYAFHGDYVTAAALLPGTGYWMKFPSAGVVFQQGTPIVAETVAVTSGWNLIGSVGSAIPVASVSSIPGGMTTSSFWEYVGGFQAATMITPGRGYFVKVAQPGSLILSSAGTAQVANHIHIALTDELPPSPPSASGAQESGVPDRFSLADPYPSPFNPSTTIQYTLPVGSRVSIRVYNILGECVGTLVEGAQSAGVHAVVWDAGMIASGLYIVRMEALDVHGGNESHVFAKKVILLR